jgi:hypothetical protein
MRQTTIYMHLSVRAPELEIQGSPNLRGCKYRITRAHLCFGFARRTQDMDSKLWLVNTDTDGCVPHNPHESEVKANE